MSVLAHRPISANRVVTMQSQYQRACCTKFWWKTYFWLVAGLLVVDVVRFPLHYSETLELTDIVDYGTWLFSLIGLFGFAYSKIILSKRLWQVLLPIVVLWDIRIWINLYAYESVGVAVVAGILILPEYLALYFYGYRSNPLWASKNSI